MVLFRFFKYFFFYICENNFKAVVRPKTKKYRKGLSVSINIELDEILDKICEEKNITKSQYIEYLIKKDINKNDIS